MRINDFLVVFFVFCILFFFQAFLFSFLASPCDSSPCKNGGTCESEGDTLTCKCTEIFYGKTCDIRKFRGIQGPTCESTNREGKGLQYDVNFGLIKYLNQ